MPASQLSAHHVDAVLRARCLDTRLRYYDGLAHTHMFALPKDVRAALAPPGAGPT